MTTQKDQRITLDEKTWCDTCLNNLTGKLYKCLKETGENQIWKKAWAIVKAEDHTSISRLLSSQRFTDRAELVRFMSSRVQSRIKQERDLNRLRFAEPMVRPTRIYGAYGAYPSRKYKRPHYTPQGQGGYDDWDDWDTDGPFYT